MQKFYSFTVCFALAFLCSISNSSGQLVINESFNGTTFPPLGWGTGYSGTSSDLENYCERVTVSSNPVGTPPGTHSGAGMARYRCGYMTQAGEKAYISSRALDFTNMPVGGTTATFWMYRDAVNTGFLDSVTVYLNDSNLIVYDTPGNTNGAALRLAIQQVAPFGFGNTVPRWWNTNPISGAAGWFQYQVTIPNIPVVTVASQRFLIFVFTNRHTAASGGNIYIDDISINTYPKAQAYVSTKMSFQGTASVPQNSLNNLIYGVEVVIDGGDDVTANNYYTVDSLNFSYIGSTNACGDAQNAKLWWTGGTDVFNGVANAIQVGATIPTLCATNYSFFPVNTFRLNNGKNYFWVTYDIKPVGTSTPGNCVDGEYNMIRLTKGGIPMTGTPVPGTLAGCRPIDVAYCGGATPSYGVGTSWLGGSYTNNDYVAQVILNGEVGYPVINNALNCCGPNIAPWWGGPAPFSAHPPDYEKFPAVPGKTTVLMANGMTSYTISLKVGTWYSSNYIAAFIDFNHDGVFTTATERIAMSPNMAANGTYTTTFTVPTTAYIGTTTLRVREVYANSNIDACAYGTYGETEDYSVTIIPTCNSWPGLGYNKLWLGGFDNDWANPLNWCPANPPLITDNALIPGSSPHRPVIKEGTLAYAKKLRIQGNDTVTVNVYKTGRLTVADSLIINDPATVLRVNSQFTDTARISVGNLLPTIPPYYPLNAAALKQRCQLVYTSTELSSYGMITGDEIDSIFLLVSNFTAPANAYTNFSIRWYYTSGGFSYGGTAGTNALAAFAIGTTPNLVYTNPSLSVPATGQYKFGLLTPIPVNLGYSLVIDICYDHVIGGGQQTWYTTTTGTRRYMQLYAIAPIPNASCDFTPTIRAMGTANAAGVTTFNLGGFLQGSLPHLSVGLALSSTPAGIFAPGTTITGIAGSTITISTPTIGAMTAATQISFKVNGALSINSGDGNCSTSQRPNLTFKYKRKYTTFMAYVGGHWNNSGTFTAGQSDFTFNGANPQNIDGTNNTTFMAMSVSKPALIAVRLNRDVVVTDTLNLTQGRLQLNSVAPTAIRSLSLMSNTGSTTALTRNTGVLIAESNPPNYGNFRWKIGTPAAYPTTFTFPFANAAGTYIPVDYKVNNGDADVTLTTYTTIPANTPIPTGVSDIYMNTWFAPPFTDNSPYMVDRFWQINDAGTVSSRDLTLNWTPTENASAGSSPYRAQVYSSSTNWGYPFIIGQTNPTATSVSIPAATFTNTWAVVRELQPLPVELLSFEAKPYKDQEVVCNWTTATELNNDFFTVERSSDGRNFEKVGTVKGAGNSTQQHDYKFIDTKPYRGVSFYRLKQTDFNGKSESFEKVAVNLSLPATPISVYPVPANEYVVFSVDRNQNLENAVLYVYDFTGRALIQKKVAELKGTGTNIFILPVNTLINGLYHFDLKVEGASLGNGKFIVEK
ncbi:MAG: hypothetical protein JNK36_02315 [Bacteroidia bacterium]|nr:hypothetical protein [Bacteroidia bacterium]MBP7714030.1 hypothetical protein [Bacteroidia bacterium]MBP8667697.1 hypothetical protein [Bacteroidia bacterium]HQW17081.1 GEVED domain-containing protein [Bacteroidia bacterium]HQW48482.1 GEVED domain-containing protein [Bacteroidia bacterium]